MIEKEKDFCAVIMIGGKSARMGGGIKSFKIFNNKTVFERIFSRLKVQISKIIINCNENHTELLKYNIPIVKDYIKGYQGPLAGIHTSMKWLIKNNPEVKWLITIPGDTPFIPKDLILKFKKRTLEKNNIIIAESNSKIHPIISITSLGLTYYCNQILSKIVTCLNMHQTD